MKKKLYELKLGIQRRLQPRAYLPNCANSRRLKALRNIHEGKRAFILGNGPSLTVADMELLRDEITFASNKIYLAYEQTDWRPSYLTCTDTIVARNNRNILLAQKEAKLFGHGIFPEFSGTKHDIIFCNRAKDDDSAKEWNLVKGIRTGHSVIYYDLQLAYWMGIREVYVLGVDFSFDVRSKKTGEKAMGNEVIEASDEKNHFHPDYRKPGETWTMPKLDEQKAEFAFALKKYQSAGGSIVNVSRTTKLDVWPKANLEDIL